VYLSLTSTISTKTKTGTKTNFKADKAAHIPSIEKISLIAKEVYAIVFKELLAK
jgi:hypothetical protein